MDVRFLLKFEQSGTLARSSDFGDAQTEISVDDDNFAASDETAGDKQLGGLVDQLIEFDDRTRHQAEDFAEQHVALAEADGGFEFNVEEQSQVGDGAVRKVGRERVRGSGSGLRHGFRGGGSMERGT